MSTLRFAGSGPLDALDAVSRRALFERDTALDTAVCEDTAAIIARVRRGGDDTLVDLARRFDGVVAPMIEVPRGQWDAALAELDPELCRAIRRAAANIRAVHEAFRPVAQEVITADGVVVGRRPDPLQRVGVYAPGGRASYPSSLLMGAIPARVAGVEEVIVCSPPDASGRPPAVLLAAAAIAGVDRVFAIGGAGAIAAMAFGTAIVPPVDRIVGPGNAYVAEAKRQLAGVVGVDSPAGPSELLVLSDGSTSPADVAPELLAQAEHDPRAAVVLVAHSAEYVRSVCAELERRLDAQPRAAVIRAAFAARGAVLTARTLEEAVGFANAYAPEHLLLSVAPAAAGAILPRLRNAGTIFVGTASSVAFGDYLTGANHVLPTGGRARSASGLSTLDFVRWTSWQQVDRTSAGRLARATALLADAEGLPAHAAAARRWEAT